MTLTPQTLRALKALVFVAALIPLGRLATGVFFFPDWLGANPAEFITRSTMVFRKEAGEWRVVHVHFSEASSGERPGGV